MTAIAPPRALAIALALAAASLCAGCGSLDVVFPGRATAQSPATAQPGQTAAEKVVRLPLSAAELDCPPVEIDEGGASTRVGGPENSAVRYQFDITDTARECAPLSDSQFSLKVGASGRLLIGPAGAPGAYSVPLRITVHDENAKKDVFSKIYKIDVSAATVDGAPFTFVTEPIVLPMTRTELAEDYTLTLGFDSGKAPAAPKPHKPAATKTPGPAKTPKARTPAAKTPAPVKTPAPD